MAREAGLNWCNLESNGFGVVGYILLDRQDRIVVPVVSIDGVVANC